MAGEGCSLRSPVRGAEFVLVVLRAPQFHAWGARMFFVRKRLYEAVAAVVTFSITIGVFVLLSRHVPMWTAAMTALLVFGASLWSGL
jgi:hypothetical protein